MAYVTYRELKSGKVYDISITVNREVKKIYGFSTNKREAEDFRKWADKLERAYRNGTQISDDVREWLDKLSNGVYAKLFKMGLVPERIISGTLGDLLEEWYKMEGVVDSTYVARRTCGNRLIQFFGAKKRVNTFTKKDAEKFSNACREKYSEATWGRDVKSWKRIFNIAVELGWIRENPFKDFKGGCASNHARDHFITQEEAERILDACPNSKMRLIFCLGRYGGLRIPSELKYMEWNDIDLSPNADRFVVKIPKKTGKLKRSKGEWEVRAVPLFRELYKAFTEYREDCNSESNLVFPNLPTGQAITHQFSRILNRAGVPMWEKFFNNMRSTRDTELREQFPSYFVNKWIGHVQDVAERHYIQISSLHFARAAGIQTKSNTPEGGRKSICSPTPTRNVQTVNQTSNPQNFMVVNMGVDSPEMGENIDVRNHVESCKTIQESEFYPVNYDTLQEIKTPCKNLQGEKIASQGLFRRFRPPSAR